MTVRTSPAETEARSFCRAFFFDHLRLRPLEGTALGVKACDGSLEDLSPGGQAQQRRFYRRALAEARAFLAGGVSPGIDLDLQRTASICSFNLHMLEVVFEHATNLEQALEVQEAVSVQVLRARGRGDWASLGRRLSQVPAFLWQLAHNVRALKRGVHRRFAQDILAQTAEIARFLESELPAKAADIGGQARRAAEAYREFGRYIAAEVLPRARERFALGEAEYGWRMREGLGVREPLGAVRAWGRRRVAEILARMGEVARSIDRRSDVRTLMRRLGRPHPASDAAAIRQYAAMSRRARDFVLRKGLFDVPPDYRVEVIPAPPGMGDAITTAAYFPAPPFDRGQKGYFLVAVSRGRRERLEAHNPCHAVSTAVHEAFPGHDLQYSYWQKMGARFSPVRWLRGDPRNWADSMNAEGYAHYAEELMREHGFYTPHEELFQLAAQAWRAARIVVDIGLHAGGMTIAQAADYLERHAFLPRRVADGEAFRYSKWPTQAVTYALGRRSIESLKDRCREDWGAGFSEARFHGWFLSFGPLPPDIIARATAGAVGRANGRGRG